MNPRRFHEAVKAAQDLLAKMPAVRSAILFGSTARGSATEDSDIDLFIECKAEREEEVARALYGIEGVFNVRFAPTSSGVTLPTATSLRYGASAPQTEALQGDRLWDIDLSASSFQLNFP